MWGEYRTSRMMVGMKAEKMVVEIIEGTGPTLPEAKWFDV